MGLEIGPVAAWRFDGGGRELCSGQPLAVALQLDEHDALTLERAMETRRPMVRLRCWDVPGELVYSDDGGVLMGPPAMMAEDLLDLRRYRAACEGARDGFWLWDLASGKCWMSPQFKELLGYDHHELPNTLNAWLACLHPDERDQIWADFRTSVHRDDHYDIEHRLRHKNGAYGWYRFRGRTVFSAAGQPLQAGGSLIDIGTRKALEANLTSAMEAARAANDAKSVFLAHMSHELRTPMNGVTGMLDLAMMGELDPHQAELLSTARRSAEDLLIVLNDILDLSKIESGRLDLEEAPFSPWDAVDEVVGVFAPGAMLRGVSVAVQVEASVPETVSGDPVRYRQVVKNLISNAVKFTSEGEISVRLSYADNLLTTEVTDSGIGIDPERLQAIFHPFTQADASTTRQFGGTGLGLTIAHQLAQQMGGGITVESEQGRGSRFRFAARFPTIARQAPPVFESPRRIGVRALEPERTALERIIRSTGCQVVAADDTSLDLLVVADSLIPTTPVAPPRPAPTVVLRAPHVCAGAEPHAGSIRRPARRQEVVRVLKEMLAASTTRTTQRPVRAGALESLVGTGRVLVVEDHPVNQLVTRMLLEHLGVPCDVVGDGVQAIESVVKGRYELVLMDCSMPVLDGYAATERIRRMPHIAQPYIVALTASAMKGDRERCLESGMDEHITKPVTEASLARTLSQFGVRTRRPSRADQA